MWCWPCCAGRRLSEDRVVQTTGNPLTECPRAGMIAPVKLNIGEKAAEPWSTQGDEVEVLACESQLTAKSRKIGLISGCLRSPTTGFVSPFQTE